MPTDGLALPSSTWLTKLGETLDPAGQLAQRQPAASRAARIAGPSCTGLVPAAVVAMDTSLSCAMGLYTLSAVSALSGRAPPTELCSDHLTLRVQQALTRRLRESR